MIDINDSKIVDLAEDIFEYVGKQKKDLSLIEQESLLVRLSLSFIGHCYADRTGGKDKEENLKNLENFQDLVTKKMNNIYKICEKIITLKENGDGTKSDWAKNEENVSKFHSFLENEME